MKLRKLAALLGAFALTLSAAGAVTATQPGDTGHKVDVCHADSAETKPYELINVDIASAGYPDNESGHADHGRDGVWYPGAKDDKFDWGDIIPPYTYENFSFPGLNWTTDGQALWEEDCESKPAIHIEKTPSVATLPVGGGSVTYTYVVTNPGNVPLTDVWVADDKCTPANAVSGDEDGDHKLDVNESWIFMCTTTLTVTTTNVAVATGYAGDDEVTDEDDAIVTVTPRNPAIHIEKDPSLVAVNAPGGPVTYTFVVTNTGNVPLTSVDVDDDKCSPVTYVSGDTDGDDQLDLTESWTFTCTADITEDTTNIGTATGHDGDTTVTDTDDATVVIVGQQTTPVAAIHVEKTPSTTTLPAGGGSVTYTYVVTNAGNVVLTDVTVADDKCTPVTYGSGDTNDDDKLDLAESWTFTCTTTITATTTNVAVATGHDGEDTVTDDDTVTVPVGSDGGVEGETNVPDAPSTDTVAEPTDAGGALPLLLIVLGIIGLAAVTLTPARVRR